MIPAAARSRAGRPTSGIRRKIWVAFILQVATISFATVLGVYGASAILQDVLIRRALTDEAGHFWDRRQLDPTANLPDTYNLRGYLLAPQDEPERLPKYLRELELGYHSQESKRGNSLILVEDGPGGRLYLEFEQQQVARLALLFGFVPLAVVLVVIYVVAFVTYRASRRAVSPLIWLSEQVQQWDPKKPDIEALRSESLPVDVEGEVATLAAALRDMAERARHFLERERDFTRDASHELRTPLTVIRMACELLEADGQLDKHGQRTLQRIRGAARDMEALIESFLILAREDERGFGEECFVANELVDEEVDKAMPLLWDRPLELVVDHACQYAIRGPRRALAVVLSNLIRNACLYTEMGTVKVSVKKHSIEIEDTGRGMSEEDVQRAFEPFFRGGGQGRQDGHGIGLSIVRRLSDRFGWTVRLESTLGVGTRAIIEIPQTLPPDDC